MDIEPTAKQFMAQLSIKVNMLTNCKMPTIAIIVGILTFISMINTKSMILKARKFLIFQAFSFVSD